MKLSIAYLYPEHLNLYGDNGNVEILKRRAGWRGIEVEIHPINHSMSAENLNPADYNFMFMGGGPDSSQKQIGSDFFSDKSDFIKNYIEDGGVGLFICGAYQLLGNYYQASDGSRINGLGVFNVYTRHFGPEKPRCIGNVYVDFPKLFEFNKTPLKSGLVGFENHGGRSYLQDNQKPFATVKKGHGNNSEDQTEGAIYKNAIGTYLHGPVLSRNPHFADYLIAKSLNLEKVENLPEFQEDYVNSFDELIYKAHTASTKLKQ